MSAGFGEEYPGLGHATHETGRLRGQLLSGTGLPAPVAQEIFLSDRPNWPPSESAQRPLGWQIAQSARPVAQLLERAGEQ